VWTFVVVVGVGGAGAGCDPTPEKIARWKETERGPGKLREAVKAERVAAPLRAQALVALVEIGMAEEALRELGAAPEAARQSVVREAVPRLVALAGTRPGRDTTRVEREAKDALFALREQAAAADRAEIDRALVAWTTVDLVGRAEQGRHSTEKILRAIGPAALPRLVALVGEGAGDGGGDRGPAAERAAGIAAEIAASGAPEAERARVGDVLIEAAKKSVQRRRDVSDGYLTALARFGQSKTTAYLVELAESGPAVVRDRALKALATGAIAGDAVVLSAALRLAGDRKAAPKVREAAFFVAEKVGPTAVKGLVALLGDPDEVVRWRAVEAALAAGKAEAVEPVLAALSPSKTYSREDLDSYVVHDLTLIGPPALAPLRRVLSSESPASSWVGKLCAIRAIARLGTAADATTLAPLAKDDTKLKGLKDQKDPGGGSLGAEARAAMASLQSKTK
jgi:hypothetical protein